MKGRTVLASRYRYTPPLWPVYPGAVGWLLLDRFHAPAIVMGFFWCLAVLFTAGSLIQFVEQEEREPVWKDHEHEKAAEQQQEAPRIVRL